MNPIIEENIQIYEMEGYPIEVCPDCEEKAMVIHGIGHHSDGGQYVIGGCENCGFQKGAYPEEVV